MRTSTVPLRHKLIKPIHTQAAKTEPAVMEYIDDEENIRRGTSATQKARRGFGAIAKSHARWWRPERRIHRQIVTNKA